MNDLSRKINLNFDIGSFNNAENDLRRVTKIAYVKIFKQAFAQFKNHNELFSTFFR